jgi:hypothetical protein
MTIEELESRLVDKKNGRKKRKNASADNWSPDLGEVRVNFEPDATNPDISLAEGESELSAESRVS